MPNCYERIITISPKLATLASGQILLMIDTHIHTHTHTGSAAEIAFAVSVAVRTFREHRGGVLQQSAVAQPQLQRLLHHPAPLQPQLSKQVGEVDDPRPDLHLLDGGVQHAEDARPAGAVAATRNTTT